MIVGGGLCGLSLAYLLTQKNISVTLLEAADRLGGRIHTMKGNAGTPLELGATWFSDQHPTLLALTEELGLTKYPQFSGGTSLFKTRSFEPAQAFYVPEAEQPSYRIAGGTGRLIDKLVESIAGQQVLLKSTVSRVHALSDGVRVETKEGMSYRGDKVVLCMPPAVAGINISFSPELAPDLTALLPTVQTWMAGSIKFVLEYDTAFWRNSGFSGMLYSHTGIVTEMYDHTNYEENKFGFTGFLNSGAVNYSPDLRRELVLRQLSELFGAQMLTPLCYADKVWNDQFVMAGTPVIQVPHQHNGHPLLQPGYMDGKLFFCGTETSVVNPGYMDGAVAAAKAVFNRVLPT